MKAPSPVKPDARVIARYALFQVPATILLVAGLLVARQWVNLPAWLIWLIIGLWLAKELVLFPFVWRAYDARRTSQAHSMIGQRGVAQQRLDPSGYVRVRGELWQAERIEGAGPVEQGAEVEVVEEQGLKLKVRPV